MVTVLFKVMFPLACLVAPSELSMQQLIFFSINSCVSLKCMRGNGNFGMFLSMEKLPVTRLGCRIHFNHGLQIPSGRQEISCGGKTSVSKNEFIF